MNEKWLNFFFYVIEKNCSLVWYVGICILFLIITQMLEKIFSLILKNTRVKDSQRTHNSTQILFKNNLFGILYVYHRKPRATKTNKSQKNKIFQLIN